MRYWLYKCNTLGGPAGYWPFETRLPGANPARDQNTMVILSRTASRESRSMPSG
jgi:hypothetical protein